MKLEADALIGRMQRALDVMSKRQQMIASNVGNVDTPGYRAVDLDFNAELTRAVEGEPRSTALRRIEQLHFGGGSAGTGDVQPRPVAGAARADGNNVNIEREMMALAETRGRYNVATTMARLRLRQVAYALSSGGQS